MLPFILDILADTYGFEGDFDHQLAVGGHLGGSVKFETIFVFEYTKSLSLVQKHSTWKELLLPNLVFSTEGVKLPR